MDREDSVTGTQGRDVPGDAAGVRDAPAASGGGEGLAAAGVGEVPVVAGFWGFVRGVVGRFGVGSGWLVVGGGWRRLLGGYASSLGVLVVLVCVFGFTQSSFFTDPNFVNILETNSPLLLVSIGITLTMLTGGFDLSVSGMLALSGMVAAMLLSHGWALAAVIFVCLAGAGVVGAIVMGFPIARLGVNFFIVSLGLSEAASGVASLMTGGQTTTVSDKALLGLGGVGYFLGVPTIIWVTGGIWLGALWLTRYTGYGRRIYAVGGNPEAARLAGINVVAVRISVYALSAALAAFAGILVAGQLASAVPNSDSDIVFTASAAVLLGGTSFSGGVGGVWGTFWGVMVLGTLNDGLLLMGVSSYWSGVVTGAVLMVAVLVDWLRRRNTSS